MTASPVAFPAADGYRLRGTVWRAATPPDGHAAPAPVAPRPIVVINPATSVRARYYARFAAWLHGHGFDVLGYDYRGIGESRAGPLRQLQAGWLEWGRLDFEAALQFVAREFPGQPVNVVGHSAGGFLLGLAESNECIARAFTMGAQFAYWRDYAPSRRLGMLVKWHGVMPALAALFGYFPGARLGWLEDTPREVVREWTARHPRFEDAYARGHRRLPEAERRRLVEGFARMRAPVLALGISDDEFGTVAALRRLHGYFINSPVTQIEIPPSAAAVEQIGHFGYFHSRFESTLWPIALHWLREGILQSENRRWVVTQSRPGC